MRDRLSSIFSVISGNEAEDLVCIVDTPKSASKVIKEINPINVINVIDQGSTRIENQRVKNNERFNGKKPSEEFEIIYNSSSASHAIQCAVNGRQDVAFFRNQVEKYVLSKEGGSLTENDNFSFIKEITDELYDLQSDEVELFKTDILRRIGVEKNESIYLDMAKNKFIKIKDKLERTLSEFIKKYSQAIESNAEIKEIIDKLEEALSRDVDIATKEEFYDKICKEYALLYFYSFELNSDKLRESSKALD